MVLTVWLFGLRSAKLLNKANSRVLVLDILQKSISRMRYHREVQEFS